MIKKNIRYLMLMAAMLLAGGSAWGDTTYYLLWGVDQNPSQLSSQGSVSGTTSWTWTMSGSFSSGKNYYFAVSSSSSYTGIISGSGAKDSDVVDGSSILSGHYKQQYNVSGTDYYYYLVSFSSARTSFSVNYDSSTGKYTFSGAATTYAVSTSITGGTISPESYASVTSGNSVTFEVTPTSGYTYTSKTYDGGTSGDITQDGNTFTFTPTGSGTFTVVYSLKYSVTPSVSGGTVSPSTTQTVEDSDDVTFTVTPTTGYLYSTCSYPEGWTVSQSTNTFTVTPNSSGTLSIVYIGHSAPTVCIGKEPSFSDCALTVGAYVAQRGCDNVDKFTLFYSNNSMFRSDGNYKIDSLNVNSLNISSNNYNYDIDLSDTDIEKVVNPGETLYLRLKGHNTNGWSAFSEVVPVKYECNRFVTKNLSKSFKACPGQHQFKLSDMFLSPEPTTWSAKLTEKGGSTVSPATDATADFSLVNGQMIWNTAGKTETSYVYEFTAKKAGYSDGTATLTITYSVPPASTGSFSSLSASPDEDVTPYTPVALSATGTQGDMETIEWTSVPASATFSNMSGNTVDEYGPTATFRVNKVSSAMDYTVTVTGYNNTNCSSASESVTIKVKPDTAEDCD